MHCGGRLFRWLNMNRIRKQESRVDLTLPLNYSRVGLMAGGRLEDLDSREVVHHLTEVMEGGREAFQYRQKICQTH